MLNTIISGSMSVVVLLICLVCALVLGVFTALVFSIKNNMSSSLFFTLVILPCAMCMVTMMVNGNLGLAISVAGGFSLVRFRSIAGNGRDISAIFIVMAVGVITGMGYVVVAMIFFVVVAIVVILLSLYGVSRDGRDKLLRVTLPDNYDYEHLFDDLFKNLNIKYEIERIRTTNLGSLIEVTYRLNIPNTVSIREFLDDIRSKNANLEVQLSSFVPERDRL